jgi:hypothetical protein
MGHRPIRSAIAMSFCSLASPVWRSARHSSQTRSQREHRLAVCASSGFKARYSLDVK